ncbi:MAG: hypothetical protein U0169_08425 [Polyangiaceae bacterium]
MTTNTLAPRSRSRRTSHSVALAILALVLVAGCKKAEPVHEAPPPAPQPVATVHEAPTMTFASGDAVDVKWNASWWKAEVLAVNAGTYRIHYAGWSSSWDEDVTPDRVRAQTADSSVGSESTAAAPSAALAAKAAPVPAAKAAVSAAPTAKSLTAAAFKPGDKVDVNWNGQWWQGQVLGVSGTQYKVHYVGWASSWDELVPVGRLRAPTSAAKRGSGA